MTDVFVGLALFLSATAGCRGTAPASQPESPARAAQTQPTGRAEMAPAAQPESPGRVEPARVGDVPNLTRSGELFMGGQPSATDLSALAAAGVRTVINLRHERELEGFDEAAAAEAAGLRYVGLPWSGAAELTDAVFDSVRELLVDAAGGTFLHCASANRVGAVWIPFRVLEQGEDLETAVEEARRVGLRSPDFERLAREYVGRNR